MKINDSIIKKYLEHVYFINGTAYAGKSSVCKMLSEKYDMYLCEENFKLGKFLEMSSPELHPNLNYFKTKKSWEEFVTRDKEVYVKWLEGVSREISEFEIMELLSLPKDKKIIVDSNMPHDILMKISDRSRVAYMVTTPEISRDEFFKRTDTEKQFLLDVIKQSDEPEKNLENYKDMILLANRQEVIDQFKKSGFFFVERKTLEEDVYDKFKLIEEHFGLNT